MKSLLKIMTGFSIAAMGTVAAAQTYNLDPNHTYPSFEASHLNISLWRGKFGKTTGKVVLDRAKKTGSVTVTIEAASIDFGHQKMNEHVRNPDFFNVEKFPAITYKGHLIKFKGDTPVAIEGELTLLGITKPVNLVVHSFKCIEHPALKREVCGADASGSFKRSDFGMSYGLPRHGDEVKLQIQAEGVKAE